MPELPEVEVTRRGLAPAIVGRSVTAVNVRTPKLREPLQDLAALLPGFQLVEEHSLTEGMAEFLPIYKVLGKIPLVRNISNRIVVLQK